MEEQRDHIWKQVGYWDGENSETHEECNGPKAICTKCNEPAYFLHEDWKELPDEQKIPLTSSK